MCCTVGQTLFISSVNTILKLRHKGNETTQREAKLLINYSKSWDEKTLKKHTQPEYRDTHYKKEKR